MIVLAILALGAIGYIALVRFWVRNFYAAWFCLLALNFLNLTFGTDQVFLAGLHLAPLDLFNFSLLPAGIIRFRYHELKLNTLTVITACYLILFSFSAARGLSLFSLTTVGNEARGILGNLLAMIYFTTIPPDRKLVKKIVLTFMGFSAAMLPVIIGHLAGLPIGGAIGINGEAFVSEGYLDRPIGASPTAWVELSIVFAASWIVYRRHPRWMPVLTAIFIVVVITMQHRTVWAMLIVSVLASAFLDQKLFRYLLKSTGVVLVLGGILGLGYLGTRTQLSSNLQESATNGDTLQWRLQSWAESLAEEQTPTTVFFGFPIGSGYVRLDSDAGGFTDYPPHNELINQYLRVGILGAGLLLLFMLRPIYIYFRNPKAGYLLFPTPESWVLVTIGVIVFGIPYSGPAELFALIAMTNGLINLPATAPLGSRRRIRPRLILAPAAVESE